MRLSIRWFLLLVVIVAAGNLSHLGSVSASEATAPLNPVDLTPAWLNVRPSDICVDGDYAYVSDELDGFHIFDISDPANPVWVNRIEVDGLACLDIVVDTGHAYVTTYSGLLIVDIGSPDSQGSAQVVRTIGEGLFEEITVSDGCAYLIERRQNEDSGLLHVVDIGVPESARITTSIEVLPWAKDVAVSDGVAYVTGGLDGGMQIIAIDPPESARVVNSVDTSHNAYGIAVSDGYTCVAGGSFGGLTIVGVDPLESAHVASVIDTQGRADQIAVSDGYIFLTGLHCLKVIEGALTDLPESAQIVRSVEVGHAGTPVGIAISGGYAYVADRDKGLQVFDIDPPESTELVSVTDTPSATDRILVSDDYAYVQDWSNGCMYIYDIAPASLARIVRTIRMAESGMARGPECLAVSGSYAYLLGIEPNDNSRKLHIVDISEPESASIVASVEMPFHALDMAITDGYAMVTIEPAGDLQIVDIDPVESAHIVSSLSLTDMPPPDGYVQAKVVNFAPPYVYVVAEDTHGGGTYLHVIDFGSPESPFIAGSIRIPYSAPITVSPDGYAYVLGSDAKDLQIIDVDPAEALTVVGSADLESLVDWVTDLDVSGGYAFLTNEYGRMLIADVDPPQSAYVEAYLDFPHWAYNSVLSGGYAYVADSKALLMVDIDPPESAYVVSSIEMPGFVHNVVVSGNYACVACGHGGLRIIKLW